MKPLFLFCALLATVAGGADSLSVQPLVRAHAHNDYEHKRPLLDALDQGFCSIEADVWLAEGRLLVAHDLKDVGPERTLEALYFDPLRARVRQNGGRVFKGGPSLTLLVDVKSDATNTYLALRELFRRYEEMLTRFHPNKTDTNAVTVIISGNRARELMNGEAVRLAGYDGRLNDLSSGGSGHFVPLISDNWALHFKWRALSEADALPEDDRSKLNRILGEAHRDGRRVRFWGMPDSPVVWRVLADAGVDLINTDDLTGLGQFLRGRPDGRGR
jgi:hypothetical protein